MPSATDYRTFDPEILRGVAESFNPDLLEQKLSIAAYSILKIIGQKTKTSTAVLKEILGMSRFDIDWALGLLESKGWLAVRWSAIDWDTTTLEITAAGRRGYGSLRSDGHTEPLSVLVNRQLITFLVDKCPAREQKAVCEGIVNFYARSFAHTWPSSGGVDDWQTVDASPRRSQAIRRLVHEIESVDDWKELRFAVRLYCFARKLCDLLRDGTHITSWLRRSRDIHVWLDTNFLISLMSPEDPWHKVAFSILKTMNDLRRRQVLQCDLLVAEETLQEFQALMRSVIVRATGIGRRQVIRFAEHEGGLPLLLEYTHRTDIDDPHSFGNELMARLQAQVYLHSVMRQTETFPEPLMKQDHDWITAQVSSRGADMRGVERWRFDHDVTLLRRSRRCLSSDTASWVWTFDAHLPRLESDLFGNNSCAVSNLYVATMLEATDSLFKAQADSFVERLWDFAQNYYGAVLSAPRYLGTLARELDSVALGLAVPVESLEAANLWAATVQIVQRRKGDFGKKEAKEVLGRQRRMLDAITTKWSE